MLSRIVDLAFNHIWPGKHQKPSYDNACLNVSQHFYTRLWKMRTILAARKSDVFSQFHKKSQEAVIEFSDYDREGNMSVLIVNIHRRWSKQRMWQKRSLEKSNHLIKRNGRILSIREVRIDHFHKTINVNWGMERTEACKNITVQIYCSW